MTLPIIIRPEAERDISDTVTWYDLEREGLGRDFLAAVRRTLLFIGDHPQLFPTVLQM